VNGIRFTSIQAPTADSACAAIAEYVGARIGVEASFVSDPPWQARRRLLRSGEVQIGWVCGLPYVRVVAEFPGVWLPLVAPVMAGARYGDRPVYFSDVVVRADSSFRRFADLRGCRWAYNEPESQSGNGIVRFHLATLGADGSYFDEVVEAGSHQAALEMICDGLADAAAIDSTVLETEVRADTQLALRLRIVDVLGPSPAPLWVAHRVLPPDICDAARAAMVGMADDPEGRRILERGAMLRFVAVEDADYDPIRRMALLSESVVWREAKGG
jgi:phosphonate transport system substrate-binding protein